MSRWKGVIALETKCDWRFSIGDEMNSIDINENTSNPNQKVFARQDNVT